MDTIVDPAVRKARQIEPARVGIADSWSPVLGSVVASALTSLGLSDAAAGLSVQARLDKLVVYEVGGHFKPHVDSEKEPGMFGTLVVQLPVSGGHAGGSLRVRHKGEEFAFDFSQGAEESFRWAAFFANCEHELTPVSAGARVALLYRLVRTTPGKTPAPVDNSPYAAQLAAAARAWAEEPGGPEHKLAIPLEHKYTTENLGLENLKARGSGVRPARAPGRKATFWGARRCMRHAWLSSSM